MGTLMSESEPPKKNTTHTKHTWANPHVKERVAEVIDEIKGVDPVAAGGAVAGMSAGEALGGAIGGTLGAVGGPAGAVLGASLGAFAGSSIGSKLGYDVTHEWVNPEDLTHEITLENRVQAVGKMLAKKSGNTLGGGAGAAAGGAVGTVIGGEVGGTIGSWVGEALASEVGEGSASTAYSNLTSESQPSESETITQETRAEYTHVSDYEDRVHSVASSRAGEQAASHAFSALGGFLAGERGRVAGKHFGSVVSSRLNWAKLFGKNKKT